MIYIYLLKEEQAIGMECCTASEPVLDRVTIRCAFIFIARYREREKLIDSNWLHPVCRPEKTHSRLTDE